VSVAVRVVPGAYRDSVALLDLARALRAIAGVEEAAALMATPANHELLEQAGLHGGGAPAAGPNDLVIAVRAASTEAADRALAAADAALAAPPPRAGASAGRRPPRTLESACRRRPDGSLALISVPGARAAGLARRALAHGLSALVFSDNVPLVDEIALKRQALAGGRLLLGPDCGTAYVDGIGLGFANAVPRGRVGVVAASGTGLQQLAVLLAARGEGLSHGIGVGGRDMTDAVGGLMALAALDRLAADPGTELIAVVGKPPSPAVRRAVDARLAASGKPAVACLLGPDAAAAATPRANAVTTLEDAADAIAATLAGRPWGPRAFALSREEILRRVQAERGDRSDQTRGVRGLYAGGTLAHEALGIMEPLLGPIDGNLAPAPRPTSPHRVLDLGADELTVGRAHPMLDATLRAEWIERAGRDPAAGVLLVDVVLGHGAAADPAGDLASAIESARARARADGRRLVVVATVIGAAGDPQDLADQTARLEAAGAWVLPSNAQAARAAACIAGGPAVLDALPPWSGGSADVRRTPSPSTRASASAAEATLLLGRELCVLNVGLESFAADLARRGVPVEHVAWAPPAAGDPRLAALLDLLEDGDG